jgi:glycosyltransferase involved in cell wall biosynthesis
MQIYNYFLKYSAKYDTSCRKNVNFAKYIFLKMFSVIIPLYNKAKYVEKALQSVVNQTFKEFEIIIVDDGSTDGGLEIVKKFTICNSQLAILTQPNSGVSTARNNGVKAAKYDYICFLDADDWWSEDFLKEMAALIADFPNAGIYGTSYFKVKNGRKIPAKIGVNQDFTRGYFDYFETYAKTWWMPLCTGTVCMSKRIFEEAGGFNPQLKLGEDFDLWVRIALFYPTVMINKCLLYYNQDVEQAMRAIGQKLHKPENHFIFASQQLYNQENNNPKLKILMDKLRVYNLFPYFLNKNTRQAAINQLDKVNWANQPKTEYNKYYKTPIFVHRIKFKIRKTGSKIKKMLIK